MRVSNLILPEVRDLLRAQPGELRELAQEMHPADMADVVMQLDDELALVALKNLSTADAARVVENLPLPRRADLFALLPADYAALVAGDMNADDRADLFGRLPAPAASEVLARLDIEEKTELQRLLRYPPTSAGGLMTTELVAVPEASTVEQAIGHLRQHAPEMGTLHDAYVVDPRGALVGALSLRNLVLAKPDAKVSEVMDENVWSVAPLTDQEEVARIFDKYDLLALPVIDERRHILGIVTVDDVVDVIKEEASEDIQKHGGMEAIDAPYLSVRIASMIRKRAGWLSVLFLGEMLTASAMTYFEKQISRAVVLALFVPLIISSGGNSGSQASSLLIRALALGEVKLADWWRVMSREILSGLFLGGVLGILGFLRIVLWPWRQVQYGEHYGLLGLTVACALVGTVTFGTLVGSMLPLILHRLGFDPASASAPFVATLVDVTGIVIYFGVATLALTGVLL